MTEKVNWNPFTNSALTDVQIQELDTDNNGIVSDAEMLSKWSWLAENSVDTESGFQSTEFQGVTGTANTVEEFRQQAQLLLDEYLENYFNQHLTLSEEDRTKFTSVINNRFTEFINAQLQANPNGPWDMAVVSTEFAKTIEEEMKAQEAALADVNSKINGYTDMIETSKSNMFIEAFTADENKYVTDAEWTKVRNNTVSYLMGMLLSGEINEDFLVNLNSKYQSNSNYKAALDAITQLKSCDDPIKMQQLLTIAKDKIYAFVDSMNKDKAVDAINNYAQAEAESQMVEILNKQIDVYLESVLTGEMTEAEKTAVRTYVEQMRDKYMSKITEDGTFNELTEQQVIQGFFDFMTAQSTQLVNAQVELYNKTTEIDKSFDTVVQTSDRINSNGNVTEEERQELITVAKELILNQLLSGNNNIAMLVALGESSAMSKMSTLVTQIWAETDPDKLDELRKELEDLIKTTLEKHTGDQLVSAVNSMKPVEISDRTHDKAVYNSTISSEYAAGASRSTSRGKQNEDRLKEIQDMAKADLQAYAESMKAQLKAELGANYDEAEVERYINSAINDTISLFTQNVYRKNQHGDYTTGTDNQSFVFATRSGTKKGRYVYNVKALIDTFVTMFNQESKIKNAANIDPSKATYDREDVIAASLGNKYDRNETVRKKGHKSDEGVYAEVIAEARADLEAVAQQIKASLLAEGVPIDMSKVDAWLDELIMETIDDMKAAFQYCQPSGKNTGGKITGVVAGAGLGTTLGVTGATAAGLAVGSLISGESTAIISAYLTTGLSTANAGGNVALGVTTAAAVPVVGWALAGAGVVLGALGMFTNIFGATYGQHDQNAGFFFERKSHSKSGRWGYDPQTLVNLFLSKVDAKIAEEKEAYKNKNNPNA